MWVSLLFVALQQIEGHIVAPLVFGKALRINPLLVIFALLFGGELFGILGALLALPTAAVVRETVVYLREHTIFEPWGTASPLAIVGAEDRRAAAPRCRGVRRACGAARRLLPALRGGPLHGRGRAPGARRVSRVSARLRLEDAPTAIRPTSLDDCDEQLRPAPRQPRPHQAVGPDARRELLHVAGQRLELELDQRAWAAGSAFAFAVLAADERDRLIGRVALANVVRGPWQNATLGYWIDQDSVGRGHASRAVRLALAYAFDHVGLHRVQPAIIPRNTASDAWPRRRSASATRAARCATSRSTASGRTTTSTR